MADALLLSQFVRLIRTGDKKTLEHAHYWLGDILETLVPNIVHGHKVFYREFPFLPLRWSWKVN